MNGVFTSESVTEGHPDKIADQISDAILDACLEQDPRARVACETLVAPGNVVLAGEITTTAEVDRAVIARQTIARIGYDDPELGFNAATVRVTDLIGKQSAEIAAGFDRSREARLSSIDEVELVTGAGDQGMMFGYATDETAELMPWPIVLAHALARGLADVRRSGAIAGLRPDGKTQVTVRYENGVPTDLERIVISTQHAPGIDQDDLRDAVVKQVVVPLIFEDLFFGSAADGLLIFNPSGSFVAGGPAADAGLTGRKIIVDTYGGMAPHGGGAFSGKDPSKVDRSAAYAARHVACNVVAAGIASRCLVQLAYAIGVAEQVSLFVDTFGTGRTADNGDCTPRARNVRPSSGRVQRSARPPPPGLPADSRLRSLRAHRPRPAVGASRPCGRAPGARSMLSDAQVEQLMAIVEYVRSTAPVVHSSIHGEQHWQAVARIGARIARDTRGGDLEVVWLFAILHDSRRENDHHDPEHGRRAGQLVDELVGDGLLSLDPDRQLRLRSAVARHEDGETTTDPAIGVCWDADRLCLPRVGIEPDDELLSTHAARTQKVWARGLVEDPVVDWGRVLKAAPAALSWSYKPALEVVSPTRPERPWVGYRVWQARESTVYRAPGDTYRELELRGIHPLCPAAWSERRMRAHCLARAIYARTNRAGQQVVHDDLLAPYLGCQCGLAGYYTTYELSMFGGRIAGVITVAGRVVLHDRWFRAEEAKVQALALAESAAATERNAAERAAAAWEVPLLAPAELNAFARDLGREIPTRPAEAYQPQRP